MTLFAQVALDPGGIITWLIVGLIAGWLAGLTMRGGGYGLLLDIVLGLIGAFLGGLVVSQFTVGVVGFWGSIAVAFLGACLLIALVRLLSAGRTSL